MTLAITGATGQLGRLVVDALKARAPADQIVALVRDPAKAADLGVPARAFDYERPDPAALAGVDRLLLISSSEFGRREQQHRNVIEAAKAAGVRHILYTSVLRAEASPLDLAHDHRVTEDMIRASGLAYTFLRNGWYQENYAGGVAGALANGGFIGASGEGRISGAARADYAEAAAVALTTPGHEGQVYELAGDESFTLAELAAEVSRQADRSLPYANLSEADYARTLEGFGLPAPVAAILAQADTGAAKRGLFDDSRTLSRLIGRPTRQLSAFVAEALA